MNIIWVATTGNDSTGTGSRTAPYATIEYAIQQMASGDQIRILDGTYIPTDSVVVSGLDGSIFAENPGTVFIQPEKTRLHQACVAILDANRFSVYGINVLQAADTSGNLIGMYVENVETFLAHTCAVSDFEIPSGSNGYGIFASGSLGRIEKCRVSNMTGSGEWLYGIYTQNIDQIECDVNNVVGVAGSGCKVRPVILEGFRPGPPPPTPPTPGPPPIDPDPDAHWWVFPDAAIPPNTTQRLYTAPNTGLDLKQFTFVVCVKPKDVYDTRFLTIGQEQVAPFASNISHLARTVQPFGDWYNLEGMTSSNGAFPAGGNRCTQVGFYNTPANPADDERWVLGYTYLYSGAPGNNSLGYFYQRAPAPPTLGRSTVVQNLSPGPPFGTTHPAEFFGSAVGGLSFYGNVHWLAIYDWTLSTNPSDEFDDLYDLSIFPFDLAGLVYYVDFSQMPAAKITPQIDTLGVGDLFVENWANITRGP